ncbi:MAG: hypothetical protein O7D91_02325 [Planctomycetota bacterium]|nr:hypothetical protein [Planctomycetota bacterium]
MAFYWSLKSIPEISHLPRARRKQLWARCVWYGLTRIRTLATFFALNLVVWLAMWIFDYRKGYGPLIVFVAFPFVALAGGMLLKVVAMNEARPKMRRLAQAENKDA